MRIWSALASWQRRHPWLKGRRYALRLMGCFLSVSLSTAFVRIVPEANRLFWVANGVWLAYLLLAPRNRWPAYLTVGFAAQMLGGMVVGSHLHLNVVLNCFNLAEVLLSALLLRPRSTVLPRFTDRNYLFRFIAFAVVLVPLAVGFIFAVISSYWRHTSVSVLLYQWAFSDGLGAGVTTPACVAVFRTNFKRTLNLGRNWIWLVLALAASLVVCSQSKAPLEFIVYPLLVLILLRMGLGWASMATMAVAANAMWSLMHGAGSFSVSGSLSANESGVALQLFIAGAMFILYGVSLVLESRRTAERRLQEIVALHNLVTENSRDVIMLADFDGIPRYISPAVEILTGWKPDEAMSAGFAEVVHPDDLPNVTALVQSLRTGLDAANIEYRVKRRNEGYVWVEGSLRAIIDSKTGVRTGILENVRDISEHKLAEQKLQEAYRVVETLAATDGLTGLANRRRFDHCLATEWRRAMRDQKPLSLILIDADLFKSYNDTYGHLRGDSCLKQISETVQNAIERPGDLVARFGGEEFAVLLPSTDNHGALHVAEETCAAMRRRDLSHKGAPLGIVTISLGVASLLPNPGQSSSTLIALADQALYQAKRSGRNCVCNCRPGDKLNPARLDELNAATGKTA